jgi:hypothetical protein
LSEDSEHQLDDSDFGIRGIEKSQNWTQMVPADPVDVPDPGLTEEELTHLKRPAPPEPETREYYGADGKPTPENQSVTAEQASHDLAAIRAAERAERERQSNAELDEALRAHEAGQQPQQPAQDQPQPETFEPQPQTTDPDPWAQADAQITEMLSNPVVRERIQGELTQIQTQAKAEVDGAWQQVEQARAAYVQHANALTGQLNALVLSNFPELQSVAHDPAQLAGATQLLARTNPQRAQALQDFVLRASTVAGQLEQQGHTHRQAAQQQTAQAFQRYAEQHDAKVLVNETPESVSAIRSTIFADAEAAGISKEQLYQAYNTIPAMRHSFVQGLLADGAKYRLAQRGITQARSNPVQKVQRPGVTSSEPRDDGSYAVLERQLRGKDLNPRQAAELLIAHRGRR